MDEAMLRADCARCAGLCCVSLAFDRSELFAIDKAAGEECRHLGPDDACGIHDDLAGRGFIGCALYDCRGAGQRVTRELFGGRSWRDDPAIARSMFDAFRAMREVHELLALLVAARRLPLTRRQARRRSGLERALRRDWSAESLQSFERGPLSADVAAFVESLREHLAGVRPARRRLRVLPGDKVPR